MCSLSKAYGFEPYLLYYFSLPPSLRFLCLQCFVVVFGLFFLVCCGPAFNTCLYKAGPNRLLLRLIFFIVADTLLSPKAFPDFSIKVWALSYYGLSSSFDLMWGLISYCFVLCSWWVGNLFCWFNIGVTLLILSLKIQTMCFFVLF